MKFFFKVFDTQVPQPFKEVCHLRKCNIIVKPDCDKESHRKLRHGWHLYAIITVKGHILTRGEYLMLYGEIWTGFELCEGEKGIDRWA